MKKYVLSHSNNENFEIRTSIFDTLEDAQTAMYKEYSDIIDENDEVFETYCADTDALIVAEYENMWQITEVAF